jgi:hypothetical protein
LSRFNLTKANLSSLNQWALLLLFFVTDVTSIVKSEIFAQDLTLFEEIEAPRASNGSRGSGRNSAGDIVSEPDFTLVGTARFGDHYSAVIGNGSEQDIRLDKISGSMIYVPGYPGYEVIKVSSGEISIRYPAERKCLSIKSKGISCDETNVATLRLRYAEPLKSATSDFNRGENEASLQLGEGTVEQNTSKKPICRLA